MKINNQSDLSQLRSAIKQGILPHPPSTTKTNIYDMIKTWHAYD
mgnify:CR=1 FL=1